MPVTCPISLGKGSPRDGSNCLLYELPRVLLIGQFTMRFRKAIMALIWPRGFFSLVSLRRDFVKQHGVRSMYKHSYESGTAGLCTWRAVLEPIVLHITHRAALFRNPLEKTEHGKQGGWKDLSPNMKHLSRPAICGLLCFPP